MTKNFSCRLFSIIFSRECDAGQNLFSALATNVNKVLREGVENNEEYDYTKSDVKLQDTNIPNILASLAKNETKVDTLLEEVWEKFGTFLDPDPFNSEVTKKSLMKNHLSKEILETENECLQNETCWSNVEKMSRSITALLAMANQPEYFGNYLGYHVHRLFRKESYIQPIPNQPYLDWPIRPFWESKPDNQELVFDEILRNMTLALSAGKLQNVSLLDLPGFGSTVDSFETPNCQLPWSVQHNIPIYNSLMSSNNNTWSNGFTWDIYKECIALKNLWTVYMNDSKTSDFPPKIQNNTLFNFNKHIKEDMSTFLAAYAVSFPNLIRNTTIWSEIAKTLSKEIKFEKNDKTLGKYDKLVFDCVFQEPLMSHKFDEDEGCTDFFPVLTDNGLCYSFNGIETSKVWKEALRDSDLLQSFSSVFGTVEDQTRNFSGIGRSEGK